MGNEPGRVVLRLSRDPRLVAGVAGAVGHVTERAGWSTRARGDLTAATEEACGRTLPLLANGAQLSVTIEDYPDRIEVTLEHRSRPTQRSPESNDRDLLACVDRVEHSSSGGVSRTTLIKDFRSRRAKK